MYLLFIQVATLTADLEKERSKVHALKLELDKVKVGQPPYMHLSVCMHVRTFVFGFVYIPAFCIYRCLGLQFQ